jgi:hypothetical protein
MRVALAKRILHRQVGLPINSERKTPNTKRTRKGSLKEIKRNITFPILEFMRLRSES